MKNLSIYQITDDLIQLFEISEENDGVLDEEMQEALEIRADQLQTKCSNYVKVIKHLESQVALAAQEIKVMQAKKKQFEAHATRLKNILNTTVDTFGEPMKITAAQKKAGLKPNKQLVLEDGLLKLTTSQTQIASIEYEPSQLDHKYTNIEFLKVPREIFDKILETNEDLLPYIKEYHPDKKLILSELKEDVKVEGTSIAISKGLKIK